MLLLAMLLSPAEGGCLEDGTSAAVVLAERVASTLEAEQATTVSAAKELEAAMSCLISPIEHREAVILHRAYGNTLLWTPGGKVNGFRPILGSGFEDKPFFFSVDGVPTSQVPSSSPFVLQVFSGPDDVYHNRHQLLHSGYHQPNADLTFVHGLSAGDESEWMDRFSTGVGSVVLGGLLTTLGVVEVLSASQIGLVDTKASIAKGSAFAVLGSGMMGWGTYLSFGGLNKKEQLPPLMK